MKNAEDRECSKILRGRTITLTGKRTVTVHCLNPDEREIERIEVDGCAITTGPRCDWLVVVENEGRRELFVELKGSDVPRAIKQLESSIVALSADKAKLGKRAMVVLRKAPPKENTLVQRTQKRFKRDFNSSFETVRDKGKTSLY